MDKTALPVELAAPFPYAGPDALRQPIESALRQVVDPEVAMTIVDVGLVYGVTVTDERVHVLMTMTSAACPVADVIVGDVEAELDRVVPAEPEDPCRAGLGASLDPRPDEPASQGLHGLVSRAAPPCDRNDSGRQRPCWLCA